MQRPDRAYKEFVLKAEAGAAFLDSKIKEDNDQWVTASELAQNATAPEYLIDGILESKTHGLLAGGSQAFKSFCVLKMAHSICTGRDFFGYTVYKTGKVLYICGEGMGALGRRIRALNIVDGDIGDNLIVKRSPLAIDNIADMDWLRQQINLFHPALIIFDTFSSLATSTGENVNEEVARTLRMVTDSCSDNGTTSIIVHHYGKDTDRGSRGASAFSANVDFELSMRRDPNSDMAAVITCKKSKDGEYFEDINIKAQVVDLGMPKQNGHSTTSLVLKRVDNMLGARQQKALDTIKRLILIDGIDDKDIIGVQETQLRRALLDAFRGSLANPSKVFYETIPELKDKGLLAEKDGFFWIP
jgi:RecA-family ATPase